jgi:haloalkane dehalogenase
MNTSLPLEPQSSIIAKDLARPPEERRTGFGRWHAISQGTDDMAVGYILNQGSAEKLTEAEIAAYDAPFPDKRSKAGAIVFPRLVPFSESQEGYVIGRRALSFWNEWEGKSFMAIGAADPVLGLKAMQALRDEINNCPEPMVIEEASHFVQEWGEDIAKAALEHFGGA